MKTTLEYLKDRYHEEQLRFDHFENKCAKFITFVSIVIAVITAIAGAKEGIIFRPECFTGWMILIAFIVGSFSICCAWGHSLLALRIGECPGLPRGRETAIYLLNTSTEEKLGHLFNCYIDTLEKLKVAIDTKSKNLELAYQELSISAWALAAAAVLTAGMEITK